MICRIICDSEDVYSLNFETQDRRYEWLPGRKYIDCECVRVYGNDLKLCG